jgi:uncharacterized protein (DUF2062 family)
MKQGMSPGKLSATIAVGSVVGIIPAIGIATLLSTAVAARFRLNIAATVLIVYLMQPLQILLAIPFIKLGIYWFGMSELRLSFAEMITMFQADWLHALKELWVANLAGISAWALLAIPAGILLYLIILPIFKRVLPPVVIVSEVVPEV